MNPQLFRYWMARVRPIATPRVWMPMVGAGMVGSFMWVSYQSPESLSFISGGEGAGESESSSIGADIDSVSVLMQEIGTSNPDEANLRGRPNGTKPSASAFKLGTVSPADAGKSNGDGAGSSLAQLVRFTPDGTGLNGTGLNSSSTPVAQNALFTRTETPRSNPLAQAIDRLTGQPSGQGFYNSGMNNGLNNGFNNGLNNGTASGINSGSAPIEGSSLINSSPAWTGIPTGGTTGLTTSTPPIAPQPSGYGNPNPANAYTNLTGAPSGYALPDTGVATPIAPAGSPIAPNTGLNSGNFNSGVVTPLPLPGAGSPESVSVPSEQVFSVPRSIPGRSIGGGNINTFSNP